MTSQPKSEPIQVAILACHRQLMASFAQANAAGVAAVYAVDGLLLPAYSAAITGQAAIQAFWQGCLDMGIGLLQRPPTEVELLGTIENEVGRYALYGHNGRLLDVGKYIIIWKQQGELWKIQHDIWTSNLSLPR